MNKTKKGQRSIAPKKGKLLLEQDIKKKIQKGINNNIEQCLNKAMASDTRKFSVVKKALVSEPSKKTTS